MVLVMRTTVTVTVTMTMMILDLHDHRQGWRFWRPTREGDGQLPSVKEHVIP